MHRPSLKGPSTWPRRVGRGDEPDAGEDWARSPDIPRQRPQGKQDRQRHL